MNVLPPLAPIDATLALRVEAPRALRRTRRHVLASMPFLGLAGRRAVRRATGRPGGGPFVWHTPFQISVSRSAAPVAPSAPAPAAAASRDVLRLERVVERSSAVQSIEPRSVAAVPSLVWAARWREIRTYRQAADRRSATVIAPDGVRRRAIAASPPSVAGEPAGRAPAADQPSLLDRATAGQSPPTRPAAPRIVEGAANSNIATSAATRPAASEPQKSALVVGDGRRGGLPQRQSIPDPLPTSPVTRDVERPRVKVAPQLPLQSSPRSHATGGSVVGALASWRTWTAPMFRPTSIGPLGKPADTLVRRSRTAQTQVVELVTQALRARVTATVHEEVAKAIESVARSQRTAPAAAPPPVPPPIPRVDDRVASAMITRMRGLLREERFRHGVLR